MFFYLLCLVCAFSQVLCQENRTLTVDSVFTHALGLVKERLKESGMDEIEIPELNANWSYFKIPGKLHCKQGYLKSIGSLQKASDVTLKEDNLTTTVTVPMELDNLEYGYKSCTFTLLKLIRWKRSISVTAESNLMQIKAAVTRKAGEDCQASLSELKFDDVQKVAVKANGHVSHTINSHMAGPLRDYLNKVILQIITKKLQIVIPSVITKEYLCNSIN